MSIKTYSEVLTFQTFEGRFKYLKLDGKVGDQTFAGHRWLNQIFYTSPEWRKFRRDIIVRDDGCDLAIFTRPIDSRILIHHINPITIEDIEQRRLDVLMNPENVICVSYNTHNALHYGSEDILIPSDVVERAPNDTCPWRN